MRDSAQSLLRIIDDILDFSKIDAGRMEVEALPFCLRGLVEGAVETLAPQARAKGLALFADPPGRQGPGLGPTGRATRRGCGRSCSTCSATRSSSPSAASSA